MTRLVLVFLDEAKSALDTESESKLIATLEQLCKKMGIVTVAHRLTAMRAGDVICVLDAGRACEIGIWDELMVRRASLYALATALPTVRERAAEALQGMVC